MSVDGEKAAGIWRPLVIRGVPLHIVLPASSAVLGVALLLSGGVGSIVGGWILTIAFPLALGAFVADARAIAAPAVLWVAWLVVVAIGGSGSGLPQTPLALAVVLAALGAVGVWLGQRAVQPAVEHPHGTARSRGVPDIDEFLTPLTDPADSPSLDPSAEVNEAIAELLEEDLASDLGERIDPEEAAAQVEPQARVEGETESAGDSDDVPAGHVIEFAALREEDLISDDDAPLPAATEAGRRDRD